MRKNNYENRCLQHTTKGICFVFFNIFTIVTIYMVKKMGNPISQEGVY